MHKKIEAFNAQDAGQLKALVSPDVEWAVPGGLLRGPDQVVAFCADSAGAAEIRVAGARERQTILELGASVWAFFALAGALESGILDELTTPQTPARISERTGAAAAHGWRYSDPALLQAWGVRSTEPVPLWAERLFPVLEGLAEAMQAPTASFLDVGTGTGHLAIAMCHQYPALQVVGIDPFETALELARRNVGDAGLESRIELRPEPVQDLADESCYDLAWVPVMFLPAEVAARGLHRVRAALRPGGWALLGSLAAEGDGLRPAVLRLVSVLFGSGSLLPNDAAEMLRAAEFEAIRILPAAPGVPIGMIVGRHPAAPASAPQ